MKKFLLFAATAAMMAVSAAAVTDGQTYEPVNGIKLVNKWIFDRVHTPSTFPTHAACNTKARTAVMVGDIIYVARSEAKAIIVGNDTTMAAQIYRFKVEDGTELQPLDVTLDGKPYGVFLGVNSIGTDNFGHVWVAPYTSELETGSAVPFYSLNVETGELTLLTRFEKDVIARTDYCDVIGDITLQQAGCTVMAAGANSAMLYRWYVPQGGSFAAYEGGFDGDRYLEIIDFYPESQTQWGTAPTVKMIYDPAASDPYAGELFYVDGFNMPPILYSTDGSIVDTFEGVDNALIPESGTNGITEFELDGRNFVLYSKAQYSGDGHGCQALICEMGEGQTFAGMQQYWQIPADSLGKMSDGGIRAHCLNVSYGTEGGEPCVTIFDFKCFNGMAVYKMGKAVTPSDPDPGVKGDVTGDGEVDIADVSALINIMLGSAQPGDYPGNANIDGQGGVDIADVSALINIMLGK